METLPTTVPSKSERRARSSKSSQSSSKPSVIMAFFSCVAWLYVAGRYVRFFPFFPLFVDSIDNRISNDSRLVLRIQFFHYNLIVWYWFLVIRLWQDSENRVVLNNILKKSYHQVWPFLKCCLFLFKESNFY